MDLALEGFEDELNVLGRDTFDGFLDHMVAILVLDTLQNLWLKLADKLGLLVGENMLKCLARSVQIEKEMDGGAHLLDYSTAISLRGQFGNVVLHLLGQDSLLHLTSMLKHLLDHVVSKDVRHQLQSIRLNLAKDLFFFVAIGRFKLLLNESRSVLIPTEFNNVVVQVLVPMSD
jgi:hypothetical protein